MTDAENPDVTSSSGSDPVAGPADIDGLPMDVIEQMSQEEYDAFAKAQEAKYDKSPLKKDPRKWHEKLRYRVPIALGLVTAGVLPFITFFAGPLLRKPVPDEFDATKGNPSDPTQPHESTLDEVLKKSSETAPEEGVERSVDEMIEEVEQALDTMDQEALDKLGTIDIDSFGNEIDNNLFDHTTSLDVSDALAQISSPSIDPDIMGSLTENTIQIVDAGWMGQVLNAVNTLTGSPEFTQNMIDALGPVKQVAQAIAPTYFS